MTTVTITIEIKADGQVNLNNGGGISRGGDTSGTGSGNPESGHIKPPGENMPDSTENN